MDFLQPKNFSTVLQDQYLSATVNGNISPMLSPHNKTLFKGDISSCNRAGITMGGDRTSPIG